MPDYTYLVPADTGRVLRHYADDCLNPGLILARYLPYEAIRNDSIFNDRGRAVDKVRTDWLLKLLPRFTGAALADVIIASFDRWAALTINASRFEMRTQGRLIIGLGGKGPLEFGITLHHLTGLPYIPGSALKGVCRSYALLSLAAEFKIPVETEALKKLDEALVAGDYDNHIVEAVYYRKAFGTQEDAGECVFYDAVISNMEPEAPLFVLDVMTPHFVDYYTSNAGKAPHDGGDPRPVNYVTVSEKVTFAFAVGQRAIVRDFDPEMIKMVRRWLRAALQELGVGAKTAAGYGVFEPVK